MLLHVAGQSRRGITIMEAKDDDSTSANSENHSRMSTFRSSNRIGGRRLSGLAGKAEQPSPPSSMAVTRTAITISAATVLSVLLVDEITMKFETVQDWRYAWPLVGALYVVTGMSSPSWAVTKNNNGSGLLDDLKDSIDELTSIVPLPSNRWLRGLAALAGVGVLVGGFIDAFFPVWYTSPDLLGTRAGVEADSAAILLMLTVGSIASNINDYSSLELSKNNEDDDALLDPPMLTDRPRMKRRDVDVDKEIANAMGLPSWTLAVILCTQLWEIASATFYSWGELLGIVS